MSCVLFYGKRIRSKNKDLLKIMVNCASELVPHILSWNKLREWTGTAHPLLKQIARVNCYRTSSLESNCASELVPHILSWIKLLRENCALLGYYTASSGNFLPAFR